MNSLKYKAVYWFFTHIFLRRIGKRYPDFFKQWVRGVTDNPLEREVMFLRYMGDKQTEFKEISSKMNIDERRVFRYHKKIVDLLIS
jgi:hypothetical protein